MRLASLLLFSELVIQTTRSLAGDRAAYNPVRLLRSLRAFRHNPLFSRAAIERFRSYTRAGFHPDDWDSAEILERWTKELFDADGTQRVTTGAGPVARQWLNELPAADAMVTFPGSRFRASVRHRILWRASSFVSFSERRPDPVVL